MSQPWVPGPNAIYVGPVADQPSFLGFSRNGVTKDSNPHYTPLVTDIGGAVQMDMSYQGEDFSISFDLTNWDEVTLAQITDYAGIVAGSVRGMEFFGEVGTLCSYERAAFPVWVLYPYATKTAYAGMPLGYHFFRMQVERCVMPNRGASPASVQLTLRALREVGNHSGSGTPGVPQRIGDIVLRLYDHDMTAVASGSLT